MPEKHARLSCSASDRWIHCPASVHWSEEYAPENDTSTTYAEEGTRAHTLAEWKLKGWFAQKRSAKRPPCDDAEMDAATTFYKKTVKEIYLDCGPGARVLVEHSFRLEPYIPGGFGTSDAVIIDDTRLHIIDFKYGKGVKVEAEGNSQLRCYALGTLLTFEGLYDFDTVTTHIIQPRLDHVSSETISVDELMTWADTVLAPAARMANNNCEEAHAGEWCRFCPVRSLCKYRAGDALAAAKADFKEPAMMSNEEIGEALKLGERLKGWLDDIQAYALDSSLSGRKIPGWKVVEGRSVRKYSDEIAVVDRLEAAGYPRAITTETKILGISALEKAIGKKPLAEICGDLIIKPQGKPTLVPEEDKRPAPDSATEDFKEE